MKFANWGNRNVPRKVPFGYDKCGCDAKSTNLWDGCDIFRMLEKASFVNGEVVFKQGDQPSYIYIIKKGKIKLFVENGKTPFELVTFGEGDCFGESSIIGIRPHAATAVAQENTELVVLSRSTLMSLYESDIHLFSTLILNIAREACRRLNASSETMLQYVNAQQIS